MTNYIFCYGTLKRGCHNHSLLAGCKFICEGTIRGTAILDLGGCPGMVLTRGGFDQWAKGEVYLAEDIENILSRLDQLENEGSFYKRVIMDVQPLYHGEFYTGHEPYLCYAYIYMPAFDCEFVNEGRWDMPPLSQHLPAM